MTDRMPTNEEFETTTGDEVRDALLLLSQRGYDIYAWEPESRGNVFYRVRKSRREVHSLLAVLP